MKPKVPEERSPTCTTGASLIQPDLPYLLMYRCTYLTHAVSWAGELAGLARPLAGGVRPCSRWESCYVACTLQRCEANVISPPPQQHSKASKANVEAGCVLNAPRI
jgi:hypothetical protein